MASYSPLYKYNTWSCNSAEIEWYKCQSHITYGVMNRLKLHYETQIKNSIQKVKELEKRVHVYGVEEQLKRENSHIKKLCNMYSRL